MIDFLREAANVAPSKRQLAWFDDSSSHCAPCIWRATGRSRHGAWPSVSYKRVEKNRIGTKLHKNQKIIQKAAIMKRYPPKD
mgnify:CR=1 FL=1